MSAFMTTKQKLMAMTFIVWIATDMVGVYFYVNEQLESHPLKHLSDSNYESLWIKVYLP